MAGLQINLLDAQRSCLTGPQTTAIQESEEYREDQMARPRRPMGLELVAGAEEFRKLLVSKKMCTYLARIAHQGDRLA